MGIEVLDRGYIELVESWGSDARIIEAARMSTAKGFQGWGPRNCECFGEGDCQDFRNCPKCKGEGTVAGDEKLLRYLWEHRHHTPFEMAGAIVEVQAPIFVFREWHRHRTQSYNELSARYTPLPDINYIPSVERLLLHVAGNNRQAASTGAQLDAVAAETFRSRLRESYESSEWLYEAALKNGVPKELARLCVPVARYSRMRASANLRNWLGFLSLRMDENAQWEIRQFASALHGILVPIFPRTLALFDENRIGR
jgi:thymidylate synthase (FAD)